jgi:hypothetical protein
LISLRLGYFHIRDGRNGEFILWDWVRSLPVEEETHFVRHVRLDKPVHAKIDGRSSRGVIFKPDAEE